MKKITYFSLILLVVILFSGCSLSGYSGGGILKSIDGGASWVSKIKVNEKKNISAVSVLALEIDPLDQKTVYLGTESNGLFVSRDGAESWEQMKFPLQKNYGLAVNSQNNKIIYASGVLNKRGKIYKTEDGGIEWKEIYTEPADGTVVTALAVSRNNPQVIYAGISNGVINKSIDGGKEWRSIHKADNAVTAITISPLAENNVYFVVFENGILRAKDGGSNVEDITKKITDSIKNYGKFYSIFADPLAGGGVYVGTDQGILRSGNFGESWEGLRVIESSRNFPIFAIAVNPRNNRELIYGAAHAIYKTIDGGNNWSTFQLNNPGTVRAIKYDNSEIKNIYLGLRKK